MQAALQAAECAAHRATELLDAERGEAARLRAAYDAEWRLCEAAFGQRDEVLAQLEHECAVCEQALEQRGAAIAQLEAERAARIAAQG